MIKPRIMSKFLDFVGETPGLPGQAINPRPPSSTCRSVKSTVRRGL